MRDFDQQIAGADYREMAIRKIWDVFSKKDVVVWNTRNNFRVLQDAGLLPPVKLSVVCRGRDIAHESICLADGLMNPIPSAPWFDENFAKDHVEKNIEKMRHPFLCIGMMWNDIVKNVQARTHVPFSCVPREIYAEVDSKLTVQKVRQDLHLFNVPHGYFDVGAQLPTYEKLINRLKCDRFVLQYPWGAGGLSMHDNGSPGTMFANNEDEYITAQNRFERFPVVVTQLLDGDGWYESCCRLCIVPVVNRQEPLVYVDPPTYKPSGNVGGVAEATGCKISSVCGDEIADPLPQPMQEEYIDLMIRIGKYLFRAYNVVGFCGVDIFFNRITGQMFVHDIQPRDTGCDQIYSLQSIAYDDIPLSLFHLLVFMSPEELTADWLPNEQEFNRQAVSRQGVVGKIDIWARDFHQHDVTPGKDINGYWKLGDHRLIRCSENQADVNIVAPSQGAVIQYPALLPPGWFQVNTKKLGHIFRLDKMELTPLGIDLVNRVQKLVDWKIVE